MTKFKDYDFTGWATKNDIKCADGRTIRRDAFIGDDGKIVPIVWNHQHNEIENVLGHALLENHPEGVKFYGKLNDTPKGKIARSLLESRDIHNVSIYANQLKQDKGNVLHGVIRELSLVLAGANPGALIEYPIITHSDGNLDEKYDEAVIHTGLDVENEAGSLENEVDDENLEHSDEETSEELEHSDEDSEKESKSDKTVEENFHTLNDDQKALVAFLIAKSKEDSVDEDEKIEHSAGSEKTVGDIYKTLNSEQKALFAFLLSKVGNGATKDTDDKGGNDVVKHNVFDTTQDEKNENVLSQSAIQSIFEDARKGKLLSETFLAHAANYGIDGIEWLFPDVRDLNKTPEFIKREPSDWVNVVMNGVHHTPFSRVRSTFANITEPEARAKGYLKGHLKKEEVFSLLRRSTTPQTVYKKQKLDRDDIIDITDFDVVAWIKGEMRMMLEEEIARAILIGDGRLSSDEDKISEEHVRPIANDADLFTIKVAVTTAAGADDATKAKAFIRAAIKARKNYRGKGRPKLFTNSDILTEMLLLEDNMGRSLYETESALATKLRVSDIVEVSVMENASISGSPLMGIIVNLDDYNVGADKGGAVNLFDDFDIDYNQYKYLIETRISGALVKPYSAIVLFDGVAPTSVDGGVTYSKTVTEPEEDEGEGE